MKKLILAFIAIILTSISLRAQIPAYPDLPVGHNYYLYHESLTSKAGSLETCTIFIAGLKNFLVGGKFLTSGLDFHDKSWGAVVRYGARPSQWFKVGGQISPKFKGGKLQNTTAGLFMSGDMCRSGKFFWISNTWFTTANFKNNSIDQFNYIGMNIPLARDLNLSPLIHEQHQLHLNSSFDIGAGVVLTWKYFSVMAWATQFIHKRTSVSVGLEFLI